MQIDKPRRHYQPVKHDPTPVTPPSKVTPVNDQSHERQPSGKPRRPGDHNSDEKPADDQSPGFDEFA